MGNDQVLIQIRVDTQLKDQAVEVFDKIGIDIPTAVRMFFKAAVREQCIPFATNVRNSATQLAEQGEAEKLMRFFKNLVVYEPPLHADDSNVIVLFPLENGKEISMAMYAQLVTKVPKGCITCLEDMHDYLEKVYGQKLNRQISRPLLRTDVHNQAIPYWRVVSRQGVLLEGWSGSKELQREQLLQEGLSVVQRGSRNGSYKVENYQEHMFHFENLQIIKG